MTADAKNFTSCRYGIEHERIQPPSDQESHNDSVYFNFVGQGGIVGGVVRIGMRPNEGYSEASLVLPLGDRGTVFHYARTPLETAGLEVGSALWTSGALRIGAVEPTRRWRLRYEGHDARVIADPAAFAGAPGATWRASERVHVDLDLDWVADFPMHVLSPTGNLMPGQEETDIAYGKDHLEQFGRLSGPLRIGDHEWRMEAAPSFRDHSWGPRVWESAPDQDFVTAYLEDGARVAAVANRLDGVEGFHGIWWRPGDTEPTQLDRYEIHTSYDGGPTPIGPIGFTFGAGEETLAIEGEVSGYLPLRVGKRPVRIAQTLLRLGGGRPGHAKTDLTRPIKDD